MNSDKQNSKDRIRVWMEHVLATGGIDRFDDLHIDEIDAAWSDNGQWITGMISSFQSARSIGLTIAPQKIIALMCSLNDGPAKCPTSLDELAAQFDWTPPSLYLFIAGKESWCDASSNELASLPLDQFPELKASQIYLYEWRKEGVLRRTFIAV